MIDNVTSSYVVGTVRDLCLGMTVLLVGVYSFSTTIEGNTRFLQVQHRFFI